MTGSHEQTAVRRKLIYFIVILALFTVTLVLRRARTFEVGPNLAVGGVEQMASDLSLREQDLGEVELFSSLTRLLLTGSRGAVVCGLWLGADKKQERHEWNDLDLLVKIITKLEPHFVTPWQYQSWNLAYNVSVECDRVNDKYFYIHRGLCLLGEGNQRISDHPDMRLTMGTYYQSKFGLSDESSTLRSLLELSCIDPVQRHPDLFRRPGDPNQPIDLEHFEAFCKTHPRLVRRLRETPDKKAESVLCRTPEAVVEFLRDNWRIPSRFEDVTQPDTTKWQSTRLKENKLDRFPILPPEPPKSPYYVPETALNDNPDLDDEFDSYAAARAWFSYAQDPLIESETHKARRPRQMMTVIFQGYPARAQANVAERAEKEGWFDRPWEITGWFPGRKVVVGEGRAAAQWDRAYQMYLDHGRARRLFFEDPTELATLSTQERARHDVDQQVTNFRHFLATTNVERRPETVTARRMFHEADRYRRAGERARALELYENKDAFGDPKTWWDRSKVTGWKKILRDNPDYQADGEIQEETYLTHQKYKNLLQELLGPHYKPLLAVEDYLLQAGSGPASGGVWLPPTQLVKHVPAPILGPLDDYVDEKKTVPFFHHRTISKVQGRISQLQQGRQ